MPYNPSEKHHELFKELDKIVSYLYRGVHWHERAANYSRKNLIRGFGRWHDCEAKEDLCALQKLTKVAGDKLGYLATVDVQMIQQAENYTMEGSSAFKQHFALWEQNEMELVECLNKAIELARSLDIQIYKLLMGSQKEVQDEIMRARMVKDSFAFADWNPHDISVKSKWIHDYFENHHKEGSEININLG